MQGDTFWCNPPAPPKLYPFDKRHIYLRFFNIKKNALTVNIICS